ncbi:hypothetical protein TRIUR3_19176 [Triticum urartu]|uniref:Uncharacterized protein n=1 Tax=Triticum urartu TaxID=4572 RepID=M7ZKP4_TRIUA|nr:hypothetical protein TRIUR3_19176 [Triticum urartu]
MTRKWMGVGSGLGRCGLVFEPPSRKTRIELPGFVGTPPLWLAVTGAAPFGCLRQTAIALFITEPPSRDILLPWPDVAVLQRPPIFCGCTITEPPYLRASYITELLNDSYRFISRSKMENLKPTPRIVLRLEGYNDITRELRVIGWNDNPVPEDTAILMKI